MITIKIMAEWDYAFKEFKKLSITGTPTEDTVRKSIELLDEMKETLRKLCPEGKNDRDNIAN